MLFSKIRSLTCFLIQSELLSHIESRVETIDKDLSQLEYSRVLSELLSNEARNVLKGSALVAGDFETVVTGIYGDDVEVSGSRFLFGKNKYFALKIFFAIV